MGILPAFTEQVDSKIIIKTAKDNVLGKRTFKFDFDKNEFVVDIMNHTVLTSTGKERLEQIVEKILHDRRYKNLIYPDSYGNEIELVLMQDEPFEIVECELKRVFTEALVYHPLIKEVSDFSIKHNGDKVICEFVVHGIDGNEVQKVEELNYGIV